MGIMLLHLYRIEQYHTWQELQVYCNIFVGVLYDLMADNNISQPSVMKSVWFFVEEVNQVDEFCICYPMATDMQQTSPMRTRILQFKIVFLQWIYQKTIIVVLIWLVATFFWDIINRNFWHLKNNPSKLPCKIFIKRL